MLRLNRYIVALVLWLSFLFNVERLDLNIGSPDVSNIASSMYVVAAVMTLLGILLPQWKQVPMWRLHIVALLAYIVGLLASERPIWGGTHTYISLFELTAVLVSVSLGYMVGRLSADFIDTVRSLIFTDMDGRVYTPEQAETVIKREMQYSRRANRPLSVMLLDARDGEQRMDLKPTAQEIQQLLTRRHNLVALARLIARTLRRTDFVLDQTDEGRLVLVMPEMQKEQAAAFIQRLNKRVQQRLGLNLRWSVASFPEQGVTFEELVYQAERGLQPNTSERRSDGTYDRRDSTTDKLPIAESTALTDKLPVVESATLQVPVDR